MGGGVGKFVGFRRNFGVETKRSGGGVSFSGEDAGGEGSGVGAMWGGKRENIHHPVEGGDGSDFTPIFEILLAAAAYQFIYFY